jgi:hypothetical protein
MVPNARFTEFLKDIEPSPTTKTNSSTAHTNLRYFLWKHETFGDLWVDDFLAGSYARDTAIRPRTYEGEVDRADIDIIVVTAYQTSDRPEDVLIDLAEVLAEKYTVERINKRSVRVITSTSEIDVVPVIPDGDSYKIADREIDDWRKTNPKGHKTWSAEKNGADEFDGRFKPLVKLMKWWRKENPLPGKRPKGFVLEVLVARHAPKGETHYGEAFAKTLENIYAAYKDDAENDIKPVIQDPSVNNSDILAKVTVSQWKGFVDKCRVYAGYARKAQDADDMEEATTQWRKVFGQRFPKTASVAKAATVAASVAAPAVTGFSFPDRPAAPAKPRGFG